MNIWARRYLHFKREMVSSVISTVVKHHAVTKWNPHVNTLTSPYYWQNKPLPLELLGHLPARQGLGRAACATESGRAENQL